MEPGERRLLEVLRLFSPDQRTMLLDILSSDDETRTAKFGELYQAGGGSVAELLIDIEEDPVTPIAVRSVLKVMG